MSDLTEHEINDWKKRIDNMSHEEMARLWRFAPSGHPVFRNDLPLFDYFKECFDALGGMSAAVSKKIGFGIE